MHFLFALLTFLTVEIAAQCRNTRVRKEIRDLTLSERRAFLTAFRKLNTGTRPTRWDAHTNLHNLYRDIVHGWPVFLPWHRMFLLDMENNLKRINRNVNLPYWVNFPLNRGLIRR